MAYPIGCEEMYNTIVIGAGQAGLAMGYYLKHSDHSFLILDENQEVGEVWGRRYDSLVLFTPRSFSSLPGLELKRSEEHTSELQSRGHLVCRLLLEKKNTYNNCRICNIEESLKIDNGYVR